MPAYRSEAEGMIREAVVAKLRRVRPGARIMHEVNIPCAGCRLDVMAVDRSEILMVEIKSERDKLDRLADQVAAMRRTSHAAIIALHRKFMPDDPEKSFAWQRIEGVPWDVRHWWFPAAQDMAEAHHPAFEWRVPELTETFGKALPRDALSLLWREELGQLAADLGIKVPSRANTAQAEEALVWGATGAQLTRGICRALRLRTLCAEADPAIEGEAA